jgi:hypothetical protein
MKTRLSYVTKVEIGWVGSTWAHRRPLLLHPAHACPAKFYFCDSVEAWPAFLKTAIMLFHFRDGTMMSAIRFMYAPARQWHFGYVVFPTLNAPPTEWNIKISK